MNMKQAAEQLNGNEYRSEGTPELFKEMKRNFLFAVFGASDDLMEFRGSIDDEIGAYGGGIAYINKAGLIENECENDDCPHYVKERDKSSSIKAIWNEYGKACWTYSSEMPSEEFTIYEDGEPYCIGRVFSLYDANPE